MCCMILKYKISCHMNFNNGYNKYFEVHIYCHAYPFIYIHSHIYCHYRHRYFYTYCHKILKEENAKVSVFLTTCTNTCRGVGKLEIAWKRWYFVLRSHAISFSSKISTRFYNSTYFLMENVFK